ncbi:MAG TPA: DUF1326 domain-containing protein [Casimicrobiaceae bacterium]|jgi:hypothetical protein
MADTPRWHLDGDWFDVCKCDVPCPCEFARSPTNGECDGVLAWHVRKGTYGDVKLDGFNVVALGSFKGNLWEGAKATMGIFIDERADPRQREALQTIFGGQAGGWPGQFAKGIAEVRGIEFAAIEFELAPDLAHWRVAVADKVEGRAEALTGPTTRPGQRVQTINPPGSEVGPDAVATWGVSKVDRADAMGFKWSRSGQSSKHIPFNWNGPD